MLQEIEQHKTHFQQKEGEWAEKVKKQTEMSQQLEGKCKSLKSLENK